MTPSYTSVSRVQSAYPAVSSVAAITSGSINDLYIEPVEAEINSYVSKRYALPLGVTCPLLVGIATRETIFRIATERMLVQFPPAMQGKHGFQIAHEADQKLLQAIADGGIQLLDSSLQAISADTSAHEIYSTTKNYNPTFHEGSDLDAVRDPDKLDDILGDRDL